MADATSPEQLGFGFKVTDEASEPLGQIEKSYLKMMKNLNKTMKKINKTLKQNSDGYGDAAEAAEDAGEEQEKATGKFGEATKAIKKNWLGMDRLGISWGNFVKVLAAVSVGAIVIGVISFLVSATKKAAEFARTLNVLNESYSMNAKEGAVVASTLFSLQDRAGRSREEVASLLKAMLELGQTPAKLKNLGVSFKALARDTLDFSSATGLGLEASVAFVDQMMNVNRLSANRIRGIGNAIKSVADTTRISTDELVAFNKELEPLMAQIEFSSEDARAAFTTNMLGLAGALSDVNIDAAKATSQFGDMMNRFSEEGTTNLHKLTRVTGMSADALRSMIKDNPARLFDNLAQSLASMPVEQLQLMAAHDMSPLNFSLAEMNRLAERGKKVTTGHAQSFAAAAQKAIEESKKQEDLAKKAAKRQEALEAMGKRLGKLWEGIQLKFGRIIIQKVINPLSKRLMPILDRIAKWITTVDWGKAFDAAAKWLKDSYEWVLKNKDVLIKYGMIAIAVWAAFKLGGVSAFGKVAVAGVRGIGMIASKSAAVLPVVKAGLIGLGAAGTAAFAAAAVGVGAFAYSVYDNWDGIKAETKFLWNDIGKMWSDGAGLIDKGLSKVLGTERWDKWKRSARAAFDALWETIKAIFRDIKNLFKNILSGKAGAILGNILDFSSGESFLDRLKKGASELVSDQTRAQPTTVSQAVAPGASGVSPALRGAGVPPPTQKFPGSMTTSAPTTDRLLAKLVSLQAEVLRLMSSGGSRSRGAGAAGRRENRVLEIAGG